MTYVGFKGLHEVTTAQSVLLVCKVAAIFNKVNTAKTKVTTAVRVSIAGWIKWLEDQDMQTKDKKNRLMRIDELHKFSDGTLTDVSTALDDHLKGIRMQYLPQSIWRKSDKDRAATMIQAIDKRLKTRRIMRSLERFVGGRLYEGDFRMLQRTI
nr:hypothetical protein [Tanacetum cinerariifolium]